MALKMHLYHDQMCLSQTLCLMEGFLAQIKGVVISVRLSMSRLFLVLVIRCTDHITTSVIFETH